MFHNTLNVGSATTMTVAAVGHANQNGTILFEDCGGNNITNWAAAGALVKVARMVVPVAAGGLSVDSQ